MATSQNIVIKKNKETTPTFAYAGSTASLTPVIRLRQRSAGAVTYSFTDTVTFASNAIVWNVTSKQANEGYFPAYYEVLTIDTSGTENIISNGYALLQVPKATSQPDAPVQIDPAQLSDLYATMGTQVGDIESTLTTLAVNLIPKFGIAADGRAYYDSTGVTEADSATLISTENGLEIVPIVRSVEEENTSGVQTVRGISQYLGPNTSEPEGYEVQPEANVLTLVPLDLPPNLSVDAFSIRITRTNKDARLRFGLYKTIDESCDVFKLITEPTAVKHVKCSKSGTVETVFSQTSRLPTRVWLGIVVQNVWGAPPTFAGVTGRLVSKAGPNPMVKSVGYRVENVTGALPRRLGIRGQLLDVTPTAVAVLARVSDVVSQPVTAFNPVLDAVPNSV